MPYDYELDLGDFADLVPHLLQCESRQCKRRVRDLPYQLVRLLGVPVHRLPWREQRSQLPSPQREWVCLQQRKLLRVPYEIRAEAEVKLMRYTFLLLLVLVAPACRAQEV